MSNTKSSSLHWRQRRGDNDLPPWAPAVEGDGVLLLKLLTAGGLIVIASTKSLRVFSMSANCSSVLVFLLSFGLPADG